MATVIRRAWHALWTGFNSERYS